jgi:RimJ/RimL family protein N-acetyltransferase
LALRKPLVDPIRSIEGCWRDGLPEIRDDAVTLRELRHTDAGSLVDHLSRPSVLLFQAPCPSTREGFARFIRWARSQRRLGAFACYGIVPAGQPAPVGVIQFWPIERDFSTAEWGFTLGEDFWGSGLFLHSARLAIDMAFARFGIQRLEARAVDANIYGNRALARLGATREGILRGGFRSGTDVRDHVMWSILASEWDGGGARARHAN